MDRTYERTSEICCQLPIAEPPCRLMVLEVPSIWREVRPEDGFEVVIVPHINRGVTKCY